MLAENQALRTRLKQVEMERDIAQKPFVNLRITRHRALKDARPTRQDLDRVVLGLQVALDHQ